MTVAASYQSVDEQITFRGRDDLLTWFQGTDLAQPGLARLLDWRDQGTSLSGDDHAAAHQAYAGIGRIH